MNEHAFSRSEMLLGASALETLQNSHVALFGLGGVGGYCAEALARAGVGALTLVDHDCVSLTNLNRQLYALHSTLGQPKAAVAARRIADINPDCSVRALELFYGAETAHTVFDRPIDAIADAIDTVTAKLDLIARAKELGIPVVSCMGTGNKLNAALLRVSDIGETSVCPLCRVMRRELRTRGIDRLPVIWSPEPPLTPQGTETPAEPDGIRKKAVPGSVSFVPPVAGMLLAGEIIHRLLNL